MKKLMNGNVSISIPSMSFLVFIRTNYLLVNSVAFAPNEYGLVLACGSSDGKIATASGRILTEVLTNREKWIYGCIGSADSFLVQLNTQIELQANSPETHHCNHIILPAAVANIVTDEVMACVTCQRRMGRSVMYHCCV